MFFRIFLEDLEKKLKSFALKAARPEVAADTEDTMEFAVEEETAS
jgi:hypothetical protein